MATLDPSQLTITKTETPGQLPPSSSLVFGQTFTDHMLQVKWTAARGWEAPVIKPYGDLAISPAASVLHYATTLFEGMKVRCARFVSAAAGPLNFAHPLGGRLTKTGMELLACSDHQ